MTAEPTERQRRPWQIRPAALTRQVPVAPGLPLCTVEGDPDDWFPDRDGGRPSKLLLAEIAATKAICHRCPVRGWCAATYGRGRHGIVAGFLLDDPAERERLAIWAGNTNGPPEGTAG